MREVVSEIPVHRSHYTMIIVWWKQFLKPKWSAVPNKERFARIADAVSYGMGTPTNISIWTLAIAAWFCLFAFNPNLQNTDFLPSWFTSNSFNFPLNTVTTVAELVIGFLIAAAANRVEKRNYELHQHMAKILEHVEKLVEATDRAEREEIKLLRSLAGSRFKI